MQSTTGKFYIATAINYTNGAPHFGHAYEAIAADYLARYNRVAGKDVFFLTGTDEHGQKVAESAEREKLEPIQLCDKYVDLFKNLNEKLSISNNDFIRTTAEKHIKTSQWLWKKAESKGDIYLGAYEGWYNTREEAFVTETEAKASNYLDADSGKPLIKTKESSYFFKMSKYQEALIAHINANPDFILPEERRNEMLARLQEPLLDLSCSRTTFSWGVPVPDSPTDEKHIMYVWFDALTNYLSGVDYATNGDLAKFFPADVHVIGKDICWFHSVIWPCMLMSCELPLPKTIFCHGFICGPDGRKMSKSIGNVVDPQEVLKEHTSDALRYFALREGAFGHDINYNPKALLDRHDSELQASLGNLAQRGLKLCESECGGKIPDQVAYEIFNIEELRLKVDQAVAKFNIQGAIELVFEQLRFVNNWIAEKAPWKMKGAEQKDEKQKVIKTVLEAMYVLGHLLFPVIPTAMGKLFANLGTPATTLPQLSTWSNLKAGTAISCAEQLFPRVGESRFEKKTAAGGAAPAAGGNQQPKKGGGPQPGQKKGGAPAAPEVLDAKKVDLRVCKILKCEPHPKAAHLYVETIDCGDATGPRQVVSGLAKFIPLDQMQNRMIVCVCNLKPDKFQGVQSEAMVLCASNADHTVVELVEPPADARIGERIAIEGFVLATDPFPVQLNPKKKEWQAIAPDYKTNDKMQACYKGILLQTSAGPCTSKLADAPLG